MWRKPAEAKPSPKALDSSASSSSSFSVVPSAPSTAAPSAFSAQPAFSPAPLATQVVSSSSQPAYPAASAAASSSASLGASGSQFAAGLKINGEITGDSDLLIEGEAHGKIRLPASKVTVGPHGRVHADIEAREISVLGKLSGNLKASDRVTLGPASRVQGSVLSPRIAIEDGARFRGKVEMTRPADSQFAASAAASKSSISGLAAPLPLSALSEKD
jgi:cytoskeletal protein CcmA (bactofilin family)